MYLTVDSGVLKYFCIYQGDTPVPSCPIIIPLWYGVRSGPLGRLPLIGPSGVRGIVLWGLKVEELRPARREKRDFSRNRGNFCPVAIISWQEARRTYKIKVLNF